MSSIRTGAVRHARHLAGSQVHLRGWVRTVRKQKAVSFLEVNDGSSVKGCQVVTPTAALERIQDLALGAVCLCMARLSRARHRTGDGGTRA